MNRQLSLYLDVFRFIAAALVFLSHLPHFVDGYFWQLAGFGHEAVVFFFVLSGFVIAFVCTEKQESAFDYVINRTVRIYSVAVPAILLTFMTYAFIQAYNPASIADLQPTFSGMGQTLFSALTFTNQSWTETRILIDMPYWSMGYEVLYYLFFGVMFYVTGWRRWFYLLPILLLMGFSILLYLPVWLAGVWCFRMKDRLQITLPVAVIGFCFSVIAIAVGSTDAWEHSFNLTASIAAQWMQQGLILETAQHFFTDYFLTVCIVVHILCANKICKSVDFNLSARVQRWIREISAHTFSLYLLHMPLLYLVMAVFPAKEHLAAAIVAAVLLVPMVIWFISRHIESARATQRNWLGVQLKRVWQP